MARSQGPIDPYPFADLPGVIPDSQEGLLHEIFRHEGVVHDSDDHHEGDASVKIERLR